jgi:hypothetical protein
MNYLYISRVPAGFRDPFVQRGGGILQFCGGKNLAEGWGAKVKQPIPDFQAAVERAALHLRIAAWFAVPQIALPPTMWAVLDAAVTLALAGTRPE